MRQTSVHREMTTVLLIFVISTNTICEIIAFRTLRPELCSARGVRKKITTEIIRMWQSSIHGEMIRIS